MAFRLAVFNSNSVKSTQKLKRPFYKAFRVLVSEAGLYILRFADSKLRAINWSSRNAFVLKIDSNPRIIVLIELRKRQISGKSAKSERCLSGPVRSHTMPGHEGDVDQCPFRRNGSKADIERSRHPFITAVIALLNASISSLHFLKRVATAFFALTFLGFRTYVDSPPDLRTWKVNISL